MSVRCTEILVKLFVSVIQTNQIMREPMRAPTMVMPVAIMLPVPKGIAATIPAPGSLGSLAAADPEAEPFGLVEAAAVLCPAEVVVTTAVVSPAEVVATTAPAPVLATVDSSTELVAGMEAVAWPFSTVK